MLSMEQIRAYVFRLGLTHDQIAKYYIGENGKSVSRPYISTLINGNSLTEESYFKLMNAVNKAQSDS